MEQEIAELNRLLDDIRQLVAEDFGGCASASALIRIGRMIDAEREGRP